MPVEREKKLQQDVSIFRFCAERGMDYQQMAAETQIPIRRLYYLHYFYLKDIKMPFHNGQKERRKLTEEQVHLVRKLLGEKVSTYKVARLLEVSQPTIAAIATGRLYTDVKD